MFLSFSEQIWTSLKNLFWGARSKIISFLIVVILIFSSIVFPETSFQVRQSLFDMLMPVVRISYFISSHVQKLGDTFVELWNLQEEMTILREKNQSLQQWQLIARRLERENAALRSLSNMPPLPKINHLTARLMTSGSFFHSGKVLIDVGSRHGVVEGAIITDGFGVLGRISAVSEESGWVLLLTDAMSKIPVMIERTGGRAILAGRQNRDPVLEFVKDPLEIREGDVLITVRDGGVIVPDLPVGVVKKIDSGKIEVALYAHLDYIDYVKVIYISHKTDK